LGWFDSSGGLLAADDDSGGGPTGVLSSIEGLVPASGTLTFAVTGFEDLDFLGQHGEIGSYELEIQIEAAGLQGDYNADGSVDAADYVVFRKGMTSGTYATWRQNFGEPDSGAGGEASQTQVPEPAGIYSICAVVFAGLLYWADARCRTSAAGRPRR
jgi:hypothetical protein